MEQTEISFLTQQYYKHHLNVFQGKYYLNIVNPFIMQIQKEDIDNKTAVDYLDKFHCLGMEMKLFLKDDTNLMNKILLFKGKTDTYAQSIKEFNLKEKTELDYKEYIFLLSNCLSRHSLILKGIITNSEEEIYKKYSITKTDKERLLKWHFSNSHSLKDMIYELIVLTNQIFENAFVLNA